MNDSIMTITLPPEAKNEHLHISSISFFEDTDEHGSIFLEGWQNFRMIQRSYLF